MNRHATPPHPHPDPEAAAYQLMLALASLGADPEDHTPIHQLADDLWRLADHIAHRYVHALYQDVTTHWPNREAIAQANTVTAERFTRIYQAHHNDHNVGNTPQ